jgi:hypothetical protein
MENAATVREKGLAAAIPTRNLLTGYNGCEFFPPFHSPTIPIFSHHLF